MTGEALRERVGQIAETYDVYVEPEIMLAAICDELGITRDDVRAVREAAEDLERTGWDATQGMSLAEALRALLDGAGR